MAETKESFDAVIIGLILGLVLILALESHRLDARLDAICAAVECEEGNEP